MSAIQNEIDILKRVKHPNIIKLYQVIENHQFLFIVMEYATEGDLYTYLLKKKRLDEKEAFSWFIQLVNAVEYLHSQGIAHRFFFKK